MNADDSNKGHAEPGAEAEHEGKKTGPRRRKTMEALIQICGVLVVIGGLLIGYLGVSGGFTNQRILALWILYGTLFFVLTGGFLYFLSRQYEAQANAPEYQRAYISLAKSDVFDFERGRQAAVLLTFRNSGKTPASDLQVITQILQGPPNVVLDWDAVSRSNFPDAGRTYVTAGDTGVQHYSFPPQVTNEDFDAIRNGSKRIYVFGKVFYKDAFGHDHVLEFCRWLDPAYTESLAACPDRNREIY